ncbi:protein disulfide oxidoreductase [Vibrio sp. LaRot3]|uniref:protein disulfide oxidoreductase n=1 Tax=Vibrio sp. LaRot3 TaxID=2998829 RepID=UPI0022CDDDCD|nr:protein disulfide oxidoreductase [Vibrio sp. LaRot3]MDA0147112.1 protein disulfide oxidoreductase [Vibrio sp. LaRot3]
MSRKNNKSTLKQALVYLSLFVIVTLVVDIWRTKDMPIDNAPVVSGFSQTGQAIDILEMSKEKPVIVYFWATWCAACKFVTPTIDWFSDTFQVVGISLNSGPNQRVEKYMAHHELTFANINDIDRNQASTWGITVTPTIAIVNDGKIETITTGITTPVGLYARLWLAKF